MFKKLFIPSDDSDLTSMALLITRLWFGLAMLFNHGFDKLAHFKDIVGNFPDPLGVGQEASLVMVVMAEVGAALLLAVGFLTRIAAAVLVIAGGGLFSLDTIAFAGTDRGRVQNRS